MGRSCVPVVVAAMVLSSGLASALGQAYVQPVLPAAPAGVTVTRSFGMEFAEVNVSGNPNWVSSGPGPFPSIPEIEQQPHVSSGRGSVSQPFRITRTAVPVALHHNFLTSGIWTLWEGNRIGTRMTDVLSARSWMSGGTATQVPLNFIGNAPVATNISVQGAMMFCNWLHNRSLGRPGNQREDYLTGAYNLMDIGLRVDWEVPPDPTGFRPRPAAYRGAEPGARYRLPTLDEVITSTYWDPNRNGQNQGGYWTFPNRLDRPPQYLLPDPLTLQPTNWGTAEAGGPFLTDMLMFPNMQSAFGLFDTSGSVTELYDRGSSEQFERIHAALVGHVGSSADMSEWYDPVHVQTMSQYEWIGVSSAGGGSYVGFRIVEVIPSPSSIAALALGAGVFFVRRR
jgi:hypothetical protein